MIDCAAICTLLVAMGGCAATPRGPSRLEREIAAIAEPILTLAPDVVWTDAYNRLLQLAPDSIEYLAEHPTLIQPAAPDDLRVMVHTSLLHLLANPATRPRLSVRCLDTTCDLLHFEPKVLGEPLGPICLLRGPLPQRWHDLYWGDFDHNRAAVVNIDADRAALRAWWLAHRDQPHMLASPWKLHPQRKAALCQLARRYADRWTYQPESKIVRCADRWPPNVMLSAESCDYNLVRAACVWLGTTAGADEMGELITLVGSESPVIAHNAIFALRFVADERVRDMLNREHRAPEPGHDHPPMRAWTRAGSFGG